MPRSSLLLLPLFLALAACGDSDAPAGSPGTAIESPAPELQDEVTDIPPPVAPAVARYQCASDLFVEATYEGEKATLLIDGEKYELTQQVAASGALYSDDTLEWHTKGNEAVLSGGDDTRVCLRVADEDDAEESMEGSTEESTQEGAEEITGEDTPANLQ